MAVESKMKRLTVALLATALTTQIALAEEDIWEDDWGSEANNGSAIPFPLTGFAQYLYSQRSVDNDLIADDQIANESRVRIETSSYFGKFFFSYKGDIFHDAVTSHTSAENREAYVSFSPTAAVDLKTGRQILTWGTGDLLFLNDLFPKDWVAFFSGEDQQYLKSPSDAIKTSWFNDAINIDLVWSPIFDPDNFINGERFSYYSPLAGELTAAPPVLSAQSPTHGFNNGEFATRIYRNIMGFEIAGYLYKGFYKTPEGFNPETGQLYFPRLKVYGTSIRGQVAWGIGNLEFAYHDSIEDSAGENPFIPNSEIRFLIGYEKEIFKSFTLALQSYWEHMQDWEEYAQPFQNRKDIADKNRNVVTYRITYSAMNNNLIWSLFIFNSPTDKDLYALPSVKYRISDQFEVQTGGNYFKGDNQSTMFGQFEQNSNVYVRGKYIF